VHLKVNICLAEKDLELVPYCDHAPQAALNDPFKYHYLLARDPDTGSFSDYDQMVSKEQKKSFQMYKVTDIE